MQAPNPDYRHSKACSDLPATFLEVLALQGQAFLEAVCEHARQEFGCHFAVVGSLRVAEVERMYVQAISQSLPDFDPEFYDVCSAPCQEVLEAQKTVIHLQDLHLNFPNDTGIQTLQSHSYVGCPLLSADGQSIGILVLEWGAPISQELADAAANVLETLAPRVSREVEYATLDQNVSTLLREKEVNGKDDMTVFRNIALQAASVARVKSAMIAECCGKEQTHFRVLAMVMNGQTFDSKVGKLMEYEATACVHLKSKDRTLIERDLQTIYPDNALYVQEDLQAYAGFAFTNVEGNPLGHLVLFHDRPLAPRILTSPVLRIVLETARQEIGRYVAERDRKSLEEALAVRQKLESLGLVVGTVAHDFNNKLAAIIGNTELALLMTEQGHPAHEPLRSAENSLWHARDIVSELLDFAGSSHSNKVETLNLNDAVRDAKDLFARQLTNQQTIQTDLQPDIAAISASPGQVQRVIANILHNAIEAFAGNAGQIEIKTGMARIRAQDWNRSLTKLNTYPGTPCPFIEISDNGPGMDPETLRRVFDPFFSTKDKSRGVGLAGVLGIAQRLGACLTFDSQPGLGSTFRMHIPAFDTDNAPDDHSRDMARDRVQETADTRGQVLVVDDDSEVLDVVARQIECLGFQCLKAHSGFEAQRIARDKTDIRAAIIDVRMPGMDGWQTLSLLREILTDVPVLMMSGFNQINPATEDVAFERVQVLAKPFSVGTLDACLSSLLDTPLVKASS